MLAVSKQGEKERYEDFLVARVSCRDGSPEKWRKKGTHEEKGEGHY